MQWFTFTIQQKGGKYKRALTHDIDMHPQLNDLKAKKSPVKISVFPNKRNLYMQEGNALIKKQNYI